MSERQTLSYLRNLFDQRGIRPKNKLGQNFLIDLNLLDLVLRAAELSPADLALEVGSGTGSLTALLGREAGAVLSVEIDDDFARLVEENLHGNPRVRLLHADVLENKNELNPVVVENLKRLLAEPGIERLKLVANLPYAVATP